MSGTKMIEVPAATRRKLLKIAGKLSQLNTGAAADEFWLASDDGNSGYDWGQIDLGVNKSGELLVCNQGGCSCNGPEEPTADDKYPLNSPIKLPEGYYHETEPAIEELTNVTNTLYKVLTDEEVTASEIIALPNAEVRRAAVELVGYEKVVAGAKVLDQSETDGTLLRIPLDGDEDIVLVHVKDPSTTREYFLRVPPNMKTARAARAWTFGFKPTEFVPVKEA